MSNKKTPIPKRLKEAREEAGLSQKQLGIKAGIDEFSASARMNQYETGKHIPDYFTLARIAKILKVPAAYFYMEQDDLANLALIFDNLKKKDKKSLFEIIENEFV